MVMTVIPGASVGWGATLSESLTSQNGQRHAPASSFSLQLLGDIPKALSRGALGLGNQDRLPIVRQNGQLRLQGNAAQQGGRNLIGQALAPPRGEELES